MSIPADRLVAEALSKSGLLWVTSPAGSSPVWHASVDGVAYVVTGPGEQPCPPHAEVTDVVDVVARAKESRARLADFRAAVSVLTSEDEDWERATFALRAGRLNAPAGDLVGRWRDGNTILRLVPDLGTVVVRGRLLETPAPADTRAETAARTAQPASTTVSTAAPGPTTPPGPDASAPAVQTPAAEAARDEYEHAVRAETAAPGPSPTSGSDESGDSDDAVRVAP